MLFNLFFVNLDSHFHRSPDNKNNTNFGLRHPVIKTWQSQIYVNTSTALKSYIFILLRSACFHGCSYFTNNCIHNPYKGRVNLFLLHDVTCHFLKLSIFTVYGTVIIRQCRLTIKHEYGTACLISLVLSWNLTVPEELFCFLLWKLHIKTKESPKNVHPLRCCLSLSEGQMIYSSIVQTTLQ